MANQNSSASGGEQTTLDLRLPSTFDNERLRYLDNYRLICERRIRDLAPTHPLPVLPSHCGRGNPDIDDLRVRLHMQSQLLQETASVDTVQMRLQLEELQTEKVRVEEALRREVVANEEQRNYI